MLACVKEMPGLDVKRMNVDGGAVALGHQLGCSGARLVTTLVHEMRRTGTRYGLAAMCIGVGQGISAAFELVWCRPAIVGFDTASSIEVDRPGPL